jgi:hypothetical protein
MKTLNVFLCLTATLLFLASAGWLPTANCPEEKNSTVPPKGDLTVELRPGSAEYAIRGQYSVIVRFKNNSLEAISILKPLDGSGPGRMPDYRFTAWDATGQIVKPGGVCGTYNDGLWARTKWPQDYLVQIKPGASFDQEWPVPVVKDGQHTIAFEYAYQPNNELHPPPPSAWRGSVKAPTVLLNFKLE